MENFTLYVIKASGLILLFYAAYHLLLKRETFFTSNRWFLLSGLITAFLLPFATHTRVIYTDNTVVTQHPVKSITVQNIGNGEASPFVKVPLEAQSEINWYTIILRIYILGIFFLTVMLLRDLFRLKKIVKERPHKRDGHFKLIDSPEADLPFSFFNYIVYNSDKLTTGELESIICHEKVHSAQKHSADMLIGQLFCIVFWFNPLSWMYKKSISQNLEFIADTEVAKQITDIKAYQKTLLKITVQHNCIAITNHFYQSLIKKRIRMLNTPKSRRINSLKYAMVFPLLLAFVMLFQVKTIAQAKNCSNSNQPDIIAVEIKNDMTDHQIKESLNVFDKEFGCKVIFSNIKRDKEGRITHLKLTAVLHEYSVSGKVPIERFYIIAERAKEGTDISITIGSPKNTITAKTLVFDDTDATGKKRKNAIIKGYGTTNPTCAKEDISDRITFISDTTNQPKDILGDIKAKGIDYEKAFIMIDGKEADVQQLRLLSVQPQTISTSIIGKGTPKDVKKHGEKAKNGMIILTTYKVIQPIKTLPYDAKLDPSFHIAAEQQNNVVFVINRYSDEDSLEWYTKKLKDIGISIQYSNIQRDEQGIIKGISVAVQDKDGSKRSATWNTTEGKAGIPDIKIGRREGTLVATSDDLTH